MNTAIRSEALRCEICGGLVNVEDDLCLGCLMRWAAEPEAAESAGFFAGPEDRLRIGNYELFEEIGRGGMGVIYRARQAHTGRFVATKILQDHIASRPELVARFRREAQAAACLDHPHVLPIYEVNEEADGLPFFTMKLASGGSLVERRCALHGRPREIATFMAKVARAADHAHQRGVLHRDLKPGNILFDANGEPLVSDFGLAAWLHQDSDLTRTRMIFGTPGYLAPEHLDGRPDVLAPASDTYSLGVILFELLAGRLPFATDPGMRSLRQVAETRAPLLRTMIAPADRDLETICARCLETDPSLRYRSAGDLAEDLERWLDGRPIIARQTPAHVRAWKLVRRHPSISIAITLCLVLAGTGLILDNVRRQTEERLMQATAYEHSVAILPIEDLDALSIDSLPAREAASLCMAGARQASGFEVLPVTTAPEPFPQHGDLMSFSRTLGTRYLITATIRRKDDINRLVVHLTDAIADKAIHREILEYRTGEEHSASQAIVAMVRGIREGWTARSNESSDPESSPAESARTMESYIQAGDQHYERRTPEDDERAIEAYQKALNAQPGRAKPMARLAAAMAARSSYGDREKWLAQALPLGRRAIEADPLSAEAQRTLSTICYFRGELLPAREHALEAFELQPDDARFASDVADSMMILGAIDRAIFWNRKAALRQHMPGNYSLRRGDYLAALGEFELAETACREFIEFRPELCDGPAAMANIHLLEGKIPTALEEIRALHRVFPATPLVVQTRACFEFHFGDPAVAERMFTELSSDPDAGLTAYMSVRASSALGCLALGRGDLNGRALLERALQLDEARLGSTRLEAAILFEMAANLAQLGREAEAVGVLKKAQECADWTYFQMKLDRRVQSLKNNAEFRQTLEGLADRLKRMRNNLKLTNKPSR